MLDRSAESPPDAVKAVEAALARQLEPVVPVLLRPIVIHLQRRQDSDGRPKSALLSCCLTESEEHRQACREAHTRW